MPLRDRHMAIIGAGNMGEALLRGLRESEAGPPKHLKVSAPRTERCQWLVERYPGLTAITNNREAARGADIVVVAVKPQIMTRVLNEIAEVLDPPCLLVSVAAGVPIDFIQGLVGCRVARAMPNTPAIIGEAASAVAFSENCESSDIDAVHAIFEAVGLVARVDESLLDAVTGLSGSGPAFIFTIIEALADAGVKVGLPRRQAQQLAAQTVMGAAQLLLESGEHPGVLKDRVTSPGGTAIAGLHTLEQGGLRTTLINAVQAATERARELGRQQAGHAASGELAQRG